MNAHVEVLREHEIERGWRFEVEVDTRPITVSLAWVDYEYWSGGRCAPEAVVRVVVESLLEAEIEFGDTFDASTARRWLRDLDDRVRDRL